MTVSQTQVKERLLAMKYQYKHQLGMYRLIGSLNTHYDVVKG